MFNCDFSMYSHKYSTASKERSALDYEIVRRVQSRAAASQGLFKESLKLRSTRKVRFDPTYNALFAVCEQLIAGSRVAGKHSEDHHSGVATKQEKLAIDPKVDGFAQAVALLG